MSAGRRLAFPVLQGGDTVESFLLGRGFSKRLLVVLKQLDDGLRIGGARVRSNRLLRAGETLEVCLPPESPACYRLDKKVPVLWEDADLVVYNKPAGLVCHRSGSHRTDTLENAFDGVFRAVNRLDRFTSGALIVAKHQLAAARLWRRIDKQYLALVQGRMDGDGAIRLPLEREEPYAPKQMVWEDGKPSVTLYRSLYFCREGDFTLLLCRLLTGRMHQIRAHCAAIGHPLLGDALYGGDRSLLDRQALHCASVSLRHPITGDEMRIRAPLPADLAGLAGRFSLPVDRWL